MMTDLKCQNCETVLGQCELEEGTSAPTMVCEGCSRERPARQPQVEVPFLAPTSGPVGSEVVVAVVPSTYTIRFGVVFDGEGGMSEGVVAPVERLQENTFVVKVPVGATTGYVMVDGVGPLGLFEVTE